jgi:hypothetical protein
MKRGQTTIFIIVGIIIVAIIILSIIFKPKITELLTQEVNPNEFLSTCLSESSKQVLEDLSLEGGSFAPYKTFTFNNEKTRNISYLCYTQNYYSSCTSQKPMLINYLKQKIKEELEDDVPVCFQGLISSLEKRGYKTNLKYEDFDINLEPEKLKININATLTQTKEQTLTFEDFEIQVPTKFYKNAILAQEIAYQEARFCHFNVLGYMMTYDEFKIDEFKTSDLEKIYTIINKQTKEKFRFAIRGCVIPPGINQKL